MATLTWLRLLFFLMMVWEGRRAQPVNVSSTSPEEPFPWSRPRLPTSIRPDHYYIYIHPDLGEGTFTGQVLILVTALNDTNVIVLNSKGLTIRRAFLKDLALNRTSRERLPLRLLESRSSEQLALVSETSLKAQHKYQLSISYNSRISSSYSGLYKASYVMPNGTSRTIVATHFEPTSARKVFPCFDEPSMKAVFSLVVVRESPYISLSNMPKKATKLRKDGLQEDHYLTSVRMSSYLLAFVVCDFSFSTAQTKRGLKVSIFASSHQTNQTHFALHTAVRILNFYEKYFQIPYPLPKIDMAAIPDFEAGAMENWGLLTFRETSLLYESQTDTLRNKFRVSLVVAHELAHQWFGNLVTMNWWNDLWLNEGFATYMEYKAISELEPSWCVEDELLLMDVYRALERDSYASSHPISLPVSDVAQIRQMFDIVSYSKGASIIRMLRDYLTESVFTHGIRLYLRQNRYSSAQQDDLWRALSEAALVSKRRVNVKALMDTWTGQKGYPVVSIEIQENRIRLHQELFTVTNQSGTDFLWQIPITFYTSNKLNITTHLMRSKEEFIELPSQVSWVKANVNTSGFYRVAYHGDAFRALLAQLHSDSSGFSKADRAGLIDDVFHLASQGSVAYSDALDLSMFLMKEEEFLPISVFLGHMTNMIIKFSFSKQKCIVHLLQKHQWKMLRKLTVTHNWADEGSLSDQNRRAKLLALATAGRYRAAVQEALRLFHFWMAKDGKHPLPLTLRPLIFRVGVRRGGNAEWKFLLKKYQQNVSSKEKVIMLKALCRTTSQRKKMWMLLAALQGNVIKTQDLATVVEQLAYQPRSNALVWKFLKSNWDVLLQKFSLGSPYLSGIVTSITSHLSSIEKYNEVSDFFITERRLGHLSFVKLSLEIIQVNMQWLKSNTKPIQAWLKKMYPKTFKAYQYCRKNVTYRFKWGTAIHIQI